MNFKEIQELIRMISKSDLSFFRVKDKEFEITIKTGKYANPVIHHSAPTVQAPILANPSPQAVPNTSSGQAPVAETKPTPEKKYLEIKSPMVGTFYRSSGPDKAPFVKIGDSIDLGSTVCIIEAMKLFNEIESEINGTIVKIMVEDSTPVEYDQVLFLVEP